MVRGRQVGTDSQTLRTDKGIRATKGTIKVYR